MLSLLVFALIVMMVVISAEFQMQCEGSGSKWHHFAQHLDKSRRILLLPVLITGYHMLLRGEFTDYVHFVVAAWLYLELVPMAYRLRVIRTHLVLKYGFSDMKRHHKMWRTIAKTLNTA